MEVFRKQLRLSSVYRLAAVSARFTVNQPALWQKVAAGRMTGILESEAEMPVALHQTLPLTTSNAQSRRSDQNGHVAHTNGFASYNGHSKVFENGEAPCNGKWQPFLIGVAGGTASGKNLIEAAVKRSRKNWSRSSSTEADAFENLADRSVFTRSRSNTERTSVCSKIMNKLGQNDLEHHERRVVTISADSFYRVLTDDERKRAQSGEFNFDHPDALDYDVILDTMHTLLAGKVANIPVYDFVTHTRRLKEYIIVYPADVVLFEGILVFYFPELRNLFKLKLFVDMDADTRLARRVLRDIKERGREVKSVLHQYTLFVKPAFEEFCLPTKKYADVIIPRGAENEVAINLIVQHIKEHLLPLASENGSPRRSMQEEILPLEVNAR